MRPRDAGAPILQCTFHASSTHAFDSAFRKNWFRQRSLFQAKTNRRPAYTSFWYVGGSREPPRVCLIPLGKRTVVRHSTGDLNAMIEMLDILVCEYSTSLQQ
jgi:hypothetical protein